MTAAMLSETPRAAPGPDAPTAGWRRGGGMCTQVPYGLLLLLLLAALPSGRAHAQTARLRIEAESVRVGRPFEAVLRAESRSAEMLVPGAGPVGDGTVEVIGEAGRGADYGGAVDPGTRRDSVVLRLAVFALDSADVSVPVRFVVRGETLRVATPPVRVRVERMVADTTGRLRPTLAPESFGWPLWLWAALAALVLALLWLLYRWRRRPAPPPPRAPAPPEAAPLGPHARFAARLDALAAAPPVTRAEARVFYGDLADALRVYLAERFGLATREMTTRDLARAAAAGERANTMRRGAAEMLRTVLAPVDRSRYGAVCPPPDVTRDVLAAMRALADHLDTPPPRRTGSPDTLPRTSAAARPALPAPPAARSPLPAAPPSGAPPTGAPAADPRSATPPDAPRP